MGETGTASGETGRGKPETEPETGTASVNTMAEGIFPGLHARTAGNISLMLARGVSPGWVASWSVPFGARTPAAAERGLGWGRESAVPTADPPSTTSPKPRHTSFKFLTRAPTTRSPCLGHLPSPCDVTLVP